MLFHEFNDRYTTLYYFSDYGKAQMKSIFNRKKFKYNNKIYMLYVSGSKTDEPYIDIFKQNFLSQTYINTTSLNNEHLRMSIIERINKFDDENDKKNNIEKIRRKKYDEALSNINKIKKSTLKNLMKNINNENDRESKINTIIEYMKQDHIKEFFNTNPKYSNDIFIYENIKSIGSMYFLVDILEVNPKLNPKLNPNTYLGSYLNALISQTKFKIQKIVISKIYDNCTNFYYDENLNGDIEIRNSSWKTIVEKLLLKYDNLGQYVIVNSNIVSKIIELNDYKNFVKKNSNQSNFNQSNFNQVTLLNSIGTYNYNKIILNTQQSIDDRTMLFLNDHVKLNINEIVFEESSENHMKFRIDFGYEMPEINCLLFSKNDELYNEYIRQERNNKLDQIV